MATTALNALAMIRFGHGGGGGFGFLLIGLAAIGVAIWAIARPERKESQKN